MFFFFTSEAIAHTASLLGNLFLWLKSGWMIALTWQIKSSAGLWAAPSNLQMVCPRVQAQQPLWLFTEELRLLAEQKRVMSPLLPSPQKVAWLCNSHFLLC